MVHLVLYNNAVNQNKPFSSLIGSDDWLCNPMTYMFPFVYEFTKMIFNGIFTDVFQPNPHPAWFRHSSYLNPRRPNTPRV